MKLPLRNRGYLGRQLSLPPLLKRLEASSWKKEKLRRKKKIRGEKQDKRSRKAKNTEYQSNNSEAPELGSAPHPASLNCWDHWKCHSVKETDSSEEFRNNCFKRLCQWEAKFPFEYSHSEIANLNFKMKKQDCFTRSFDICISETVKNTYCTCQVNDWTLSFYNACVYVGTHTKRDFAKGDERQILKIKADSHKKKQNKVSKIILSHQQKKNEHNSYHCYY